MILNLACARLDKLIARLLRRMKLPAGRYSRYADDLTVSSSKPIPEDFTAALRRAVQESGFRLNARKVHCYRERDRAIVICGVRLQSGAARGELALPRETLKKCARRFPSTILVMHAAFL